MVRFTPIAWAAGAGVIDAFLTQQDATATPPRVRALQQWSTFGELIGAGVGAFENQLRIPPDIAEPVSYYSIGALAFKAAANAMRQSRAVASPLEAMAAAVAARGRVTILAVGRPAAGRPAPVLGPDFRATGQAVLLGPSLNPTLVDGSF